MNRRLEFFEKDIIEWEDEGSFSDFYRKLNRFKKKNKALSAQERDGEMTEIPNDCTEKVWSFKRVNNGNEVVCVFNFSNETVNVQFNGNVPGEGFSSFPDTSQVLPVEEMELKPWEYRIYSK